MQGTFLTLSLTFNLSHFLSLSLILSILYLILLIHSSHYPYILLILLSHTLSISHFHSLFSQSQVDHTSGRCRDPERTPLQWTSKAPNFGFTDADTTPWLPLSEDASRGTNVETQLRNTSSFLSLTRKMLKLRTASPSLKRGGFASFACGEPGTSSVFCYRRDVGSEGDVHLVAVNLGRRDVVIDMSPGVSVGVKGATSMSAVVVLDSEMPCGGVVVVDLTALALLAEQSVVLRLVEGGGGGELFFSFLFLSLAFCLLVCAVLWNRRHHPDDVCAWGKWGRCADAVEDLASGGSGGASEGFHPLEEGESAGESAGEIAGESACEIAGERVLEIAGN